MTLHACHRKPDHLAQQHPDRMLDSCHLKPDRAWSPYADDSPQRHRHMPCCASWHRADATRHRHRNKHNDLAASNPALTAYPLNVKPDMSHPESRVSIRSMHLPQRANAPHQRCDLIRHSRLNKSCQAAPDDPELRARKPDHGTLLNPNRPHEPYDQAAQQPQPNPQQIALNPNVPAQPQLDATRQLRKPNRCNVTPKHMDLPAQCLARPTSANHHGPCLRSRHQLRNYVLRNSAGLTLHPSRRNLKNFALRHSDMPHQARHLKPDDAGSPHSATTPHQQFDEFNRAAPELRDLARAYGVCRPQSNPASRPPPHPHPAPRTISRRFCVMIRPALRDHPVLVQRAIPHHPVSAGPTVNTARAPAPAASPLPQGEGQGEGEGQRNKAERMVPNEPRQINRRNPAWALPNATSPSRRGPRALPSQPPAPHP